MELFFRVRESTETNTKYVNVLIHPEYYQKPGPTFIMIQSGLLSVMIVAESFVLIS